MVAVRNSEEEKRIVKEEKGQRRHVMLKIISTVNRKFQTQTSGFLIQTTLGSTSPAIK